MRQIKLFSRSIIENLDSSPTLNNIEQFLAIEPAFVCSGAHGVNSVLSPSRARRVVPRCFGIQVAGSLLGITRPRLIWLSQYHSSGEMKQLRPASILSFSFRAFSSPSEPCYICYSTRYFPFLTPSCFYLDLVLFVYTFLQYECSFILLSLFFCFP